MATSSLKIANLLGNFLGKRKPEDDLENKPVLRKHKDKDTAGEPFAFIEVPSCFGDVAVRKKTLSAGFFAPMTQTSDIIDFFKDVGQVVHVHTLKRLGVPLGHCFLEFASANQAMNALQNKNREYLHGHKILLTKIPDDEEAAVSTRTLFVANISCLVQIKHIINFFKDVGSKVVRVLLMAGQYDRHHLGYGYVEFASANQAMNALQKKKGEYLYDCKIFLATAPNRPQLPMYCIDHTVCCDLEPIKQDDETTCSFVEEVLLVANISPQVTTFERIVDFFEVFGEIVGVRLIVNHEGKHMGYGFVEFASAHEANKALEKMNGEYFDGHKIFLTKGVVKTPHLVEADAVREKTICVIDPPHRIQVSKIIDFFKDVGKIVHVRFFESTVYVEFASAHEAKEARKKKKGEHLDGFEINLCVPKLAENPRQPKYEDYLVIEEEDAAAVDETPEENVVRKKTLFITKIPNMLRMTTCHHLNKIFSLAGDVVRIRLIVDPYGKHIGCGFVEFSSAEEANEANEVLNNLRPYKFDSHFAEKARHTFRPKYNLEEKLWYEDNIRREGLDYKTIQNLEKLQVPEKEKEISLGFCGVKTTFSDDEEEE